MKRSIRITAVAVSAVLAIAGLAACSSGGNTTSGASNVAAALKKGGTLTYWGWAPAEAPKIKAFEKAYPKVNVKLVNAGSGGEEYTKLDNAIKAGSGVPDVVQLEYTAVPQFHLANHLLDLSTYGFSSLKSQFAPGPWSNVTSGTGIYALPEDSGPMALLYNKTIFDKYGLTVPTTWDEYIADAKKLHAANPKEYLTSDGGDGLYASSMIWQAGGHPYSVKGTKVSINFKDPGTLKWTAEWNQLVQGKLLSPTTSYTNDWYQQLANGQIASLASAAWMPSLLESSAAAGSGSWRVAPMPTYDGTAASANYGGSAQAVLKSTKNAALAAGFVRWMDTDSTAVNALIQAGEFPSTLKELSSPALANLKPAYFGGQQINKVFLAASKNVPTGFEYLPFQTYAQTIFADSVGQSYANHADLNTGLAGWTAALVKYGNQEGFTTTGK